MLAARAGTPLAVAALAAACFVAVGLPACERREAELPELVAPTAPTRIDPPAPSGAANPPNLVLVSIDTLRADHVGAYGYDRDTSPSLDRLAEDATLFENALSHSPKTAPSHMSLFTGVYPEAHRVKNRFNRRTPWLGRLSDDIPTLAEMLTASGYRTRAFTGGGNMHGSLGFARGFESYQVGGTAGSVFGAGVHALEELAPDDAPFFLFVHTYQVHSPYMPPKPYRGRFVDPDYAGRISSDLAVLAPDGDDADLHTRFWERVDRESPTDREHLRDLYDACIRYTDDQLGRLVNRIHGLGLAENTIVVVLSDHGEEFGEHGGFEHNALWEELLHVPLILRVPASLRPGWRGRRIAEPVSLVDVLPTLLELMEIPRPSHLQGQSLVPVVEQGAPTRPWHLAQYRMHGHAALRVGRWKLLRDDEGRRLYDLAADPEETSDASAEHPELPEPMTEHARKVLEASRGFWPLAGEAYEDEIDAEIRRQLKALGYVEEPSAP